MSLPESLKHCATTAGELVERLRATMNLVSGCDTAEDTIAMAHLGQLLMEARALETKLKLIA